MKKLTLELKAEGKNELTEMRDQLNKFALENFNLLYKGACRLGHAIDADYYAPERISILSRDRNPEQGLETRLHAHQGLKYANGHKYNSEYEISAEDIEVTVSDLQMLVDAAHTEIKAPFTLTIQAC